MFGECINVGHLDSNRLSSTSSSFQEFQEHIRQLQDPLILPMLIV
jgi:hypothetical protein